MAEPATNEGVVSSVTNAVKEGGKPFLALALVGAMIVAFALAVALYYIITRAVSSTKTYVIPQSRTPILCTTTSVLEGKNIPSNANGKRQTISFWIYINDLKTNNGTIRRVFARGPKDGFEAHGPFVALNDKMNKLHVIFATTDVSQYTLAGTNVANSSASNAEKVAFLSAVHGITIDYVPMQRWVHIAVVVNEESSSGIVMAYVDGELVKTVTSNTIQDDLKLGTTTSGGVQVDNIIPNVKLEIQNIDMGLKGDVVVGGDPSSIPGFSGLVCQIGFTNSDLNADDIYKMYIQGPITGMLSKLGLGSYGLQSPIYRIS